MACPSTGPISMYDIQAEFGGTAPASITEYYGVAPGIPTSGRISLFDFRGASNDTVDFTFLAGGAIQTYNPLGSWGYHVHAWGTMITNFAPWPVVACYSVGNASYITVEMDYLQGDARYIYPNKKMYVNSEPVINMWPSNSPIWDVYTKYYYYYREGIFEAGKTYYVRLTSS